MSNNYFDWPASASRFIRFDTVRAADLNDALDAVSAGFDDVQTDLLTAAAESINGTSTTSISIGTGSKSFTASTGRGWSVGQFLIAASAATPTAYMVGQITAYNSSTGALTISVASASDTGGSGSYADWNLNVSGKTGPTATLSGNASAGINTLMGPNIASATTMDIWTATQGNEMIVTGTTATTGFSAAPQAGASRVLIANAAWPITHGANLLLPGSASYTCAAGDIITVHAITTTQFRCEITKADGTPVVGIGITLLDVKTAASSAQLDFTQYITSTYDEYIFELVDLRPATNGVQLQCRTSTNAGSSFDSGANDYHFALTVLNASSGASAVVSSGAGQNYIGLTTTGAIGNSSTDGVCGQIILRGPSGASAYKKMEFQTSCNTTTTLYSATGCAMRAAAADIDGFRIYMSSGNIDSGSVRMYGVKKS